MVDWRVCDLTFASSAISSLAHAQTPLNAALDWSPRDRFREMIILVLIFRYHYCDERQSSRSRRERSPERSSKKGVRQAGSSPKSVRSSRASLQASRAGIRFMSSSGARSSAFGLIFCCRWAHFLLTWGKFSSELALAQPSPAGPKRALIF